MNLWQEDEIKNLKSQYATELLKHDCNSEDLKEKNLPYDAYIITYQVDGIIYKDLTRCHKRVGLFDMYYDKFGSGSLLSINFGPGKVNPKLWTDTNKKK
jgi:hypothetical protein